MTIEQLKALIVEELDSRELKSRARYSALDKIVLFIKNNTVLMPPLFLHQKKK